MFSPQVWLIGAMAFALAVGGAYIKGRTDGGAIARADQAEVIELARKVRDDAQRGAAEAIAKLEIRHTTVRTAVEKEIHEKLVYRECRHTDYALRRINSALTGADVSTEQ